MLHRKLTIFIASIFTLIISGTTVNAAPQSLNHYAEGFPSQHELVLRQLTQSSDIDRIPAIFYASFDFQKDQDKNNFAKHLDVTATAYTSHVGQTDSTPNIAAWGDRLSPGMKAIAVSRDLLNIYGLKHGQKVRIKGLSGEYAVLDKMNKRWRKKIDIYMGMDKRKAFQWGKREVEILWN